MRRFEALDSWRGVSALLVVWVHLDQDVLWSWQGADFLNHFDVVVDFFFVLSGFVMSAAYGARLKQSGQIVPFLLRRAGRIYPLHISMLLALIAFAVVRVLLAAPPIDIRAVFNGGIYDISAILTNVLLLQGVGFENHLTWNYPSWSISAEWWTYVAFALVWGVFALRSRMITIVLAVACPIAVGLFPSDSVSFMTLVRVLGGFAIGVLVRDLFLAVDPALTPRLKQRRAATLLELGALAAAIYYVLAFGTLWIAPIVFAPFVLVFAFEAGALSTWLRTRPMQWIGAISYSIYMTHAVILMMGWGVVVGIEQVTGWTLTSHVGDATLWGTTPWIGNLVALAVVAVVLALSTATYRWIELPGQRWGQRAALRWSGEASLKRQPAVGAP